MLVLFILFNKNWSFSVVRHNWLPALPATKVEATLYLAPELLRKHINELN